MDLDPQNNGGSGRSRIHPLVATAAGAVILACGIGVAAMTGILPHAGGAPEPATVAATTPAVTAAAPPPPVVTSRPMAPPPPPQQIAQAAPPPPRYAPPPPPPSAEPACRTCGHVTSIQEQREEGHGTGIGAAGGAVAGGLVGHAFGGGNGRVATTLLGALGGGLAGNTVERHVRSTTSYRVNVRMEDGTYREFHYANTPPVSDGERVRVVNGVLRTY